MAKGAYLTPRIRELITRIYLDDHQIRPTEAHKLLLLKMKAEGLHEIFGPSFPSISTVSKELKSLRERDEARSPKLQGLDKLWTIGSLSGDPIPPDAMPIVMSIYQKTLAGQGELTVREAEWIGRLYRIIDDVELLRAWAWEYATNEWVSEITHTPLDTTDLDLELVRNPQYAPEALRALQRWGAVWDIAQKYSADFDEAMDVMGHLFKLDWSTLSNEEIEEVARSLKPKSKTKKR